MTEIRWDATKEDAAIISKIVERAAALIPNLDPPSFEMDLTACHLNGTPLKLYAFLEADNLNFLHDATGIERNMNRETGHLDNLFMPRFAS